MEGISLVETATLQALISEVVDLKKTVVSTLADLSDARKPYLTAKEVMSITGFGKTWLNDNKQHIGFSMAGGELRFKRKDLEQFMEQNYFKSKSSRRNF